MLMSDLHGDGVMIIHPAKTLKYKGKLNCQGNDMVDNQMSGPTWNCNAQLDDASPMIKFCHDRNVQH